MKERKGRCSEKSSKEKSKCQQVIAAVFAVT